MAMRTDPLLYDLSAHDFGATECIITQVRSTSTARSSGNIMIDKRKICCADAGLSDCAQKLLEPVGYPPGDRHWILWCITEARSSCATVMRQSPADAVRCRVRLDHYRCDNLGFNASLSFNQTLLILAQCFPSKHSTPASSCFSFPCPGK